MKQKQIQKSWKQVLEYLTTPLQGTFSRKQRDGVKICINNDVMYENAVFTIDNERIQISELNEHTISDSYFEWNSIETISSLSIY